MWESLKIVEQCLERLEGMKGQPIMVQDKKIAWPAQLSIGSDGMGNSNEHIPAQIMGNSMEALDPPLLSWSPRASACARAGRTCRSRARVASSAPRGLPMAATRPVPGHFRDQSFTNLLAMPVMCEGSMVSGRGPLRVASHTTPVLGGVDR
jgi:NADH-quinone oxidoreductase subunit D